VRLSLDKHDRLSLHEEKPEKLNQYAKYGAKECIARKVRQCKSKIRGMKNDYTRSVVVRIK